MPSQPQSEKIIKFLILHNYEVPSELETLIRVESFKSTPWGFPTNSDLKEVTGFVKMTVQEFFRYKQQKH